MTFLFWNKGKWEASDEMPRVEYATRTGLLALGGEYSADCFLRAYKEGIFPWPCDGLPEDPIPWFSPRQRFVISPEEVHISHSLKKTLKKSPFEVRADKAFESVIRHCATVSRADEGTWITEGIIETFCELHREGYAHSIECYLDGELVGGFYGLCLGRVFGGESMFTLAAESSKVCFARFCERAVRFGIKLIDCQCETANMARYGAHNIPRSEFLSLLKENRDDPVDKEFWDWSNA